MVSFYLYLFCLGFTELASLALCPSSLENLGQYNFQVFAAKVTFSSASGTPLMHIYVRTFHWFPNVHKSIFYMASFFFAVIQTDIFHCLVTELMYLFFSSWLTVETQYLTSVIILFISSISILFNRTFNFQLFYLSIFYGSLFSPFLA